MGKMKNSDSLLLLADYLEANGDISLFTEEIHGEDRNTLMTVYPYDLTLVSVQRTVSDIEPVALDISHRGLDDMVLVRELGDDPLILL